MGSVVDKANDIEKTVTDVQAFSVSLKSIPVDFKDLRSAVNAVGHQPMPHFDFTVDFKARLEDIAQKLVEALYDRFPPFKRVIDSLAGYPEQINSAQSFWNDDVAGKLEAVKGVGDSLQAKLEKIWEGELSVAVVAVMSAENKLLDGLKEVAAAGGKIIGAVGQVLDVFRQYVLKVTAQILAFLVEKALDKLKQWYYEMAGEAGISAATAVTVIETMAKIYDEWKAVDKAIDEAEALINDIKGAIVNGRASLDDIQALAAS